MGNENEKKPVEGQGPENDQGKKPEGTKVEQTIFGKIDQKILARRKARAAKKAARKPMSKAQKAAIIGGGAAVGLGLLGLGFKSAVNAASRIPDDPTPEEAPKLADFGYPEEDAPETPDTEEEETEETEEE